MSSLQVDSISSMGGGHVDGAGKVVQFKEAVNTTEVTISSGATATILTLDFTPKFSDSLILCQGFHTGDGTANQANAYCNCNVYAGSTLVASAIAVGNAIQKAPDARFHAIYSGSIASWGTTSLAIDLRVSSGDHYWTVSRASVKTSLLVWEIAQ